MDWIKGKNVIIPAVKKYGYLFLILVVGIMLMTQTSEESTQPQPQETIKETEESLEISLEKILSHLSGAGNVEVLLTEDRSEERVYQIDEDGTIENIHRKTVLVTTAAKEDTGLLRQVLYPKYRGAVVICEGAEDPKVRLAIVEAVKSATGLTADHITVLKMK